MDKEKITVTSHHSCYFVFIESKYGYDYYSCDCGLEYFEAVDSQP